MGEPLRVPPGVRPRASRDARAPAPAGGPAAFLALQRRAGNGAVTRLARRVLARRPLAEVRGELQTSAAAWDHEAIMRELVSLDREEDRAAAVHLLTFEQLSALREHIARRHGQWPASLVALIVSVRAETHDADYRRALAEGGHPMPWDGWGPAVMLLERYADPHGGPPLDTAGVLVKARELAAKGSPALSGAREFARRNLGDRAVATRVLEFLSVEALTGVKSRPTGEDLAVMDEHQLGDAVAVAGGSVTTYDKVSLFQDTPGHFGFKYEGSEAPDTGWIQFLAPQAEKFDRSNTSVGFETEVATLFAGHDDPIAWGTDKHPAWSLDGEGDEAPFYEAHSTRDHPQSPAGGSGAHINYPKMTEMFDRPTVDPAVVAKAFDDDAIAHVVVRLKFHTYLVRRMDVLYENTMSVEFDIPRGGSIKTAPRNNVPGTGRATSTMASEHHDALVKKFPGWGFYPTR